MTEAAMNTDREIWRAREGDAYADRIHVTKEGAIGIDCGGYVIVKPVRAWHALASAAPSPDGEEVERVCRALIKAEFSAEDMADPDEYSYEQLVEDHWVDYKDQARAAIAAMRPTLSEEDRARVREVRAKLPTARRHIETMDVTGAISHRLGKDGEVCPEYCNEFVLEMTEFVDAAEAALSLIDKLDNPPQS